MQASHMKGHTLHTSYPKNCDVFVWECVRTVILCVTCSDELRSQCTHHTDNCVQDFQCVEGINFGGLSIVNSTIVAI